MTVASTVVLPVIELDHFLKDPKSPEALEECKNLAQTMQKYGAFALRDSRVSNKDNNEFLDLVENYFAQDNEAKMKDVHPELSYQVGATPELMELPRCGRDDDCINMVEKMAPENRPGKFDSPDPKWRFFWRMGQTPKETKFAQLNAAPVIPAAFPQWQATMDKWGNKLLDSVSEVSRMLAIGLELSPEIFTKMSKYGPHLLAPTGSDLEKYGTVGNVLAGFHSDLNFLTIHGKSRFPGLHIWTRAGEKLLVKIPDGCLLVQAGKQLEYVTAGNIQAGFHEVVIVEETLKAMESQKQVQRPLWRISSTLFFHLGSDEILEPVGKYKSMNDKVLKDYPSQYVGHQVEKELGFLELSTGE